MVTVLEFPCCRAYSDHEDPSWHCIGKKQYQALQGTCELLVVESLIPFDLVPLRYFMTYLTWLRCPLEGFAIYFASRFMIFAMTGRVEIDNQFRYPRYVCMVLCLTLASSVMVLIGQIGMVSTRYPDWYGVFGLSIVEDNNSDIAHRLSTHASCDILIEIMPEGEILWMELIPKTNYFFH